MDGLDDGAVLFEPGFDQSFAGVSLSGPVMDVGPSAAAMGAPLDNGQGIATGEQRAFAVDCEFIQVGRRARGAGGAGRAPARARAPPTRGSRARRPPRAGAGCRCARARGRTRASSA